MKTGYAPLPQTTTTQSRQGGPTTRHTNRNNQNNKILITKFKRLKADERVRGRERERDRETRNNISDFVAYS